MNIIDLNNLNNFENLNSLNNIIIISIRITDLSPPQGLREASAFSLPTQIDRLAAHEAEGRVNGGGSGGREPPRYHHSLLQQ